MAESIGRTESGKRRNVKLPPRRGQIKAGILRSLGKVVKKIASRVGKVLGGKKVMTEEAYSSDP